MAELTCVVVTPEETALEESADFVALPLYDGEIGIAPGRSPMIGRLGCGEMRLRVAGKTQRYYVDGGFVQVAQDVISVLTHRAVPAGQIDEEEAREKLATARATPANSPELMEARERAVAQSRARLRWRGVHTDLLTILGQLLFRGSAASLLRRGRQTADKTYAAAVLKCPV